MNRLKMDISFVTWNDTGADSVAIRIIPSGWRRPKMYHVIIEDGERSDIEYLGIFNQEQIRQKFEVNIPETWDLSDLIKKIPNDSSLGYVLRKINNDIES